jgi:hypothetical protein
MKRYNENEPDPGLDNLMSFSKSRFRRPGRRKMWYKIVAMTWPSLQRSLKTWSKIDVKEYSQTFTATNKLDRWPATKRCISICVTLMICTHEASGIATSLSIRHRNKKNKRPDQNKQNRNPRRYAHTIHHRISKYDPGNTVASTTHNSSQDPSNTARNIPTN